MAGSDLVESKRRAESIRLVDADLLLVGQQQLTILEPAAH